MAIPNKKVPRGSGATKQFAPQLKDYRQRLILCVSHTDWARRRTGATLAETPGYAVSGGSVFDLWSPRPAQMQQVQHLK